MRIKTPARPSSKTDYVVFKMGIENLTDQLGRKIFIPTIQMHVNPTSIQFQYRKIINRHRTRGGWIEEHWGDELDNVSIESTTGSFMSLETGLSIAKRHESLSMINFQEILSLFRNNACAYDDQANVIGQGDVFIEYDTFKLFGQFQSFNWEETAESPFKFTYSFSFEVKRTLTIL